MNPNPLNPLNPRYATLAYGDDTGVFRQAVMLIVSLLAHAPEPREIVVATTISRGSGACASSDTISITAWRNTPVSSPYARVAYLGFNGFNGFGFIACQNLLNPVNHRSHWRSREGQAVAGAGGCRSSGRRTWDGAQRHRSGAPSDRGAARNPDRAISRRRDGEPPSCG